MQLSLFDQPAQSESGDTALLNWWFISGWVTYSVYGGGFLEGVPLRIADHHNGLTQIEWDHVLLNTQQSGLTYRAEPTRSWVFLEEGYAPCSPFACPLFNLQE